MSSPEKKSGTYIKGLDGLRALSISFVLWDHIGAYNGFSASWHNTLSGGTGVNIFFCLSGLLITRILLNEKRDKGYISYKNFFARRLLRLSPPLILFYTFIAVLMIPGILRPNAPGLLLAMLYLYDFAPFKYSYTLELAHTWSLGVEEQYYLLWPFILHAFRKRKALIITVILFAVCCATSLVFDSLPFTAYLHQHYYANKFFIPAVAPILAGAFVSLLFSTDKMAGMTSWTKRTSAIILSLSCILFFSELYFPVSLLFMTTVLRIYGIALFLSWLLFNQDSAVTNILELKPIAYIGRISYGIYVYQGFFTANDSNNSHLWVQHFPVNIILTIVIAVLSYHFIELRVLRIKERYR